jgi:eukaryotic-like serine/threonine-protein kinase
VTDDTARRERWQQIERIYWLAAEQEGVGRLEALKQACGGDDALRQAVESLLGSGADASDFLELNGLEVAADLVAADDHRDLTGQRLGPYTIHSWLGAGGMGDVYRATDERLRRDVALKLLSPLVADDEGRLARLRREAQVLASLNHQNIAAIYGLEEANGVQALVLELVNGPTLLEILAQKRLALDDALSIGRQIAEGLEAAHACGVVHRDLKPANVAVRPDGVVKLLDFGIAAVLMPERGAEHGDPSPSPIELGRDEEERAFGTAAYSSPEQLRGRSTDRRSDIWSFGAVLYETLSGRPAFTGVSASDTTASVLSCDVDYEVLPPETPPSVRQLIARCLTSDPRQRLQDIGEARIALEPANVRRAAESTAPPSNLLGRRWRRATLLALAATLAAGLAASVIRYLKPTSSPGVTHFTVLLPEGQVLSLANGRRAIAVSPDGRQIVYAAISAGLYRRAFSQSEPVAIKGTEGLGRVSEPTFSPDGRSIAFHADGAIHTIPIVGGTPKAVASAEAPYGMSWSLDGIVFGQGGKGIMRVSREGGTAQVLVRVNNGDEAHGPQILPGGRHVLFTLASGTSADRWQKARIMAQSLETGKRVTVIDGGADARYLPTGHLIYARNGTLHGIAFNVDRLALDGAPRPLLEGVSQAHVGQTGAIEASVSDDGVLVYVPAPAAAESGQGEVFRLALIDRRGEIEPFPLAPDTYQTPRISPDGTRIAFGTEDAEEAIIWVWDLAGKVPRRRLTFGGNNRVPLWSPDGARIAFQSDREGDRGIFVQLADGSGTAERLTAPASGVAHVPQSWSPDGRTLLFTIADRSGITLWTLSVEDRQVSPFPGVSSRNNLSAAFSPDGKWVVYGAGDQGRLRIYARSFPPSGAVYQIEANGSTPSHPVWSRDGKEVFFNPGLRGLGALPVRQTPTLVFGTPMILPRAFRLSPPEQPRAYDAAPKGRFLARIPVDESLDATRAGTRIQVVLNWFDELRQPSSAQRDPM